jgi:hypothetical protein
VLKATEKATPAALETLGFLKIFKFLKIFGFLEDF